MNETPKSKWAGQPELRISISSVYLLRSLIELFDIPAQTDITPFVEGYLFKRNFVGNIPFLYNGVTASRLDRKYGYASLGVNFHY